MDIIFTMRNISPEEALSQDLLALGVRLIDIIFLEDILVLLTLLLLIRLDDILVVFVEVVVGFDYLGSHAVVATHSLSNALVFFSILFVKNYKHQIEPG